MFAQCPDCKRLVQTYAAKNAKGRGTHRRFDLHQARYSTGQDCDMSDEPVPAPPRTDDEKEGR